MRSSPSYSYSTLWSRDIARSHNKPPKPLYLYYHSTYRPFAHSFTLSRGRFRGGRGGRAPPFFLQALVFFCNHFEELQTVLFEIELIINNAPLSLTYVYPNSIKICLTTNHFLFGRQLLYSSNITSTVVRILTVLLSTADKINRISNRFLDRWRHEFMPDTTIFKIKYRLPRN